MRGRCAAGWLGTASVAATLSCGVPEPPGNTGGVDVAMGPCGRGLMVVSSDYQSTNVSLLDTAGKVLSPSVLSSASASTGLSSPLSGDVVLPTTALLGDELVLIDRYPASVLSWLDISSGAVRRQLAVGTGFAANPQDYLEASPARALVPRYESNPAAGAQPFDEGGDLLIVDPALRTIVGRVDLGAAMSDAPGFLPRAGRLVGSSGRALVLLSAYDADFSAAADSRIAAVSPADGVLLGVAVLQGMVGCTGLALGPVTGGAPLLAVSCSGRYQDGVASLDGSGVVLLSTAAEVPVEVGRWSGAELAGRPLGAAVEFVDAHRLLLTAMGSSEPPRPDALLLLDTASGAHRILLESEADSFVLGDVRCATPLDVTPIDPAGACGRCFVADAEHGEIVVLAEGPGGIEVVGGVQVDSAIGLPPRGLGRF